MDGGKPAGVRCLQLTDDNRCMLFDNNERPAVCRNLKASEEMCGTSSAEAMDILTDWEKLTHPAPTSSSQTG
jgi:uncharacterized protein